MEKKEIIEALQAELKEFKSQLPDNSEQIKALEAEIKELKKLDNSSLKQEFEDYKKASEKAMEEQGLELSKLKEQGGNPANKKGLFVEFMEKSMEDGKIAKNNHFANLSIKAAALMTTANITPETTGGFSPLFGNFIDSEIGAVPKADPFVLPLVTVTSQPGTEKIYYTDRVNEEGDAAFIAEGALKPLIDAEWATNSEDVKEVAERWKFSKRLVMHAPSIVSDFRVHANELIDNKIDDELIDGDGLTTNLAGIKTKASAFIVPPELALYYPDANIFDAIMAVATQVRLANFKGALTCILNTVWMAKMKGIKNANGDYIIPPFVSPDGTQVGEVKIVFSTKVADDEIILGDLKKFNVVWAEQVMYEEGYENDDFSKNLMSRKLEAFLGTYMKLSDAGSIVADDIATIITAIEEVVV